MIQKKQSLTVCSLSLAILMAVSFWASMYAQYPGFFLDDWQEKTAQIPVFAETEKPAADPVVIVTVDPGQVIGKVPRYIYGNNAVNWDNGLRSSNTAMNDIRNLNPHVLRWPGGNLSNNYFWNVSSGNRPADIPPDINPRYGMDPPDWQMSVDGYYALLEETGSEGIICVNYSYARYGTGPDPVGRAAHMAADWVRYDNGRTRFWELGNENFGNWQSGYEIDTALNQDGQPRFISGQLYGQHCKRFIDSMRAAAAEVGTEIYIGPNAYDTETSYNQIMEDWNEGMMPEIGDLVDFMVVHSYFTPYDQDSPVPVILSSDTVPGEIMAVIESDMAEAGKPMLPVAMTEWNIFAVGSMQQVSYINGMLAALTLGEFVKEGYGLANRWDLVNGWADGNDHGMFSKGGEPGVDAYNPRPVFFYMYYHQRYFGDRMVQASVAGSDQVVAQASTFSSGEKGVVIVNKGTVGKTAQVELENGSPGLTYYYHTLTGGSDNGDFSRKVLINGMETDEEGGGPDEYESIPAFASETYGGIKVSLPPLSVVYLLIEKPPPLSFLHASTGKGGDMITVELTEAIEPITDPSGLDLLVNGSPSTGIDSVNRDSENPSRFHIYLSGNLNAGDSVTLAYSGNGIRSLDGTMLTPFTGKAVENLVPRGPFTVILFPVESGSLGKLDECQVIFNGQVQMTDSLGRAVFEALEGEYSLQASARYYDTLRMEPMAITSDTAIRIQLNPTEYQVDIHVKEARSGEDLSYAGVTVGSDTKETGASGVVAFFLTAGSHSLGIGKYNYFSLSSNVEVHSDTLFELELEQTHARLKMQLKDGEQPIVGARVTVDGDTLLSNDLGNAVFEHTPLDENLSYSAEKEHYFSLQGVLNVHSDTTMEIRMTRSVANIRFVVGIGSGTLDNGFAVVGTDTLALNGEGEARFYSLPINREYVYLVGSSNHGNLAGTLFLEQDTIINLLFTSSWKPVRGSENKVRIFPNPASGFVHVSSGKGGIERIEFIDASGKMLQHYTYDIPPEQVEMDLPADKGIFFIRVRVTSGTSVLPLIIK